MRILAISALVLACASAPPPPPADPSDDDADWNVDLTKTWTPNVGDASFVVPSDSLVSQHVPLGASNNNCEIEFFEGRLFLAFRTAPTHFAGKDTLMHVVSSGDGGKTWKLETTIEMGTDVREPRFLRWKGNLTLHFFQGGTDPAGFDPTFQFRIHRNADGSWTAPEKWGVDGEVPWDMKVRGGKAWLTSYRGAHYEGADGVIEVLFRYSDDGIEWKPVEGDGVVYRGGVSEVAFEFDRAGDLWAVTRNEDGDATGFGGHVCHAAKDHLGTWDCGAKSFPNRWDSPEMFRHGKDLFLLARRDVGGPFDEGDTTLDPESRKRKYLIDYWNRAKRTTLYRVDTEGRKIEAIQDLPGDGDTAFPSARRTGDHTWLVANYTSPLDTPDISWNDGQTSERGTQIYLLPIMFE